MGNAESGPLVRNADKRCCSDHGNLSLTTFLSSEISSFQTMILSKYVSFSGYLLGGTDSGEVTHSFSFNDSIKFWQVLSTCHRLLPEHPQTKITRTAKLNLP